MVVFLYTNSVAWADQVNTMMNIKEEEKRSLATIIQRQEQLINDQNQQIIELVIDSIIDRIAKR